MSFLDGHHHSVAEFVAPRTPAFIGLGIQSVRRVIPAPEAACSGDVEGEARMVGVPDDVGNERTSQRRAAGGLSDFDEFAFASRIVGLSWGRPSRTCVIRAEICLRQSTSHRRVSALVSFIRGIGGGAGRARRARD